MERKIFIAEDDEKNLKLFKAVLAPLKEVKIFAEKSGDQALHSILELRPDLIILDIQLPQKSGIEICKELRELKEYRNIPIIAVTAYAMKGDKERILRAGFNHYLSKPIQVKQFRNLIKGLL